MAKRTKKQLVELISTYRQKMEALDERRTTVYRQLLGKLGLQEDVGHVEGRVWDYMFNGYGSAREMASFLTPEPEKS